MLFKLLKMEASLLLNAALEAVREGNQTSTASNHEPIETAPLRKPVLVGAWVKSFGVSKDNHEWTQTVARAYKNGEWDLEVIRSYAQDGDLGFIPQYWCETPEPPSIKP